MQDFQNQLKYYQNVENCSIFSHVPFHFWKSSVWGPEKTNVAIIPIKQLIFKNEKSHVKKFNSFQYFGNILTDYESHAFKFFRIGLTHAFILTEKFKNQQNLQFFCSENSFWKKTLLGSASNWLFWTHFWIPCAILLSKT